MTPKAFCPSIEAYLPVFLTRLMLDQVRCASFMLVKLSCFEDLA